MRFSPGGGCCGPDIICGPCTAVPNQIEAVPDGLADTDGCLYCDDLNSSSIVLDPSTTLCVYRKNNVYGCASGHSEYGWSASAQIVAILQVYDAATSPYGVPAAVFTLTFYSYYPVGTFVYRWWAEVGASIDCSTALDELVLAFDDYSWQPDEEDPEPPIPCDATGSTVTLYVAA